MPNNFCVFPHWCVCIFICESRSEIQLSGNWNKRIMLCHTHKFMVLYTYILLLLFFVGCLSSNLYIASAADAMIYLIWDTRAWWKIRTNLFPKIMKFIEFHRIVVISNWRQKTSLRLVVPEWEYCVLCRSCFRTNIATLCVKCTYMDEQVRRRRKK